MSIYSGKCDLFDFMSGYGGWYDKNGNSVNFGQEGVSAYYSDELQDFEAFKRATGGKIYQHHKITVTEANQEFVKKYCSGFDFTEHLKTVTTKSGKEKDVTCYTYTYFGKDYTLKELNKHGVYVEIPINFNTILDLIPYYPYVVTASSSSEGKSHVIIAKESYVDETAELMLSHGYIFGGHYKQDLQAHYAAVCERYVLRDLEERTRSISLDAAKPYSDDEDYYILPLPVEADYMHEVEFVWSDGTNHSHWTSPKLTEDNMAVLIHRYDYEVNLANDIETANITLRYVEKLPKKLYLG